MKSKLPLCLALVLSGGLFGYSSIAHADETITRSPASPYMPPASSRVTYNFNPGWKFFKGDVTGAEQPGFDDSKWTDVSAPHTWNDTDTYEGIISHNGGDRHESTGIGWYRKHF